MRKFPKFLGSGFPNRTVLDLGDANVELNELLTSDERIKTMNEQF